MAELDIPSKNIAYAECLTIERYFTCQVPGCGGKIKRPWNHTSQGQLHGGLKSEGKRVYIELTKAAGELMQETQPTPPNKNSEETPPQQKEQVATVSTGRERFG